MTTKISAAVERAMRYLDQMAEPASMSQEEALEFYGDIKGEVEARVEGLEADLAS